MTSPRFAAWVSRHLPCVRRPGDIVIMDNLAAHTSRRAQDLAASIGATVRYLPPHS